MSESIMRPVGASGPEIQRIVEGMEPFLMQFSRDQVLIACLSIAILIQDPDIAVENLQAGVKGASEWMCLYLSSLGEGTIPKEMLN